MPLEGHWSEHTAGPGCQGAWKVLPGSGSAAEPYTLAHTVNRHMFQMKGRCGQSTGCPEGRLGKMVASG